MERNYDHPICKACVYKTNDYTCHRFSADMNCVKPARENVTKVEIKHPDGKSMKNKTCPFCGCEMLFEFEFVNHPASDCILSTMSFPPEAWNKRPSPWKSVKDDPPENGKIVITVEKGQPVTAMHHNGLLYAQGGPLDFKQNLIWMEVPELELAWILFSFN